jgi:hypothetical protein
MHDSTNLTIVFGTRAPQDEGGTEPLLRLARVERVAHIVEIARGLIEP